MINAVPISAEFKKMTKKALASIFLFILTYIFMVTVAIALTFVLSYVGYLLIDAYPSWITVVLGLILLGVGIVVLIFVFKFIFKRIPRAEQLLIEIQATEEPALFALITEVAKEVGTSLPKRVYLSPEVNAGVFYDSLFFSMFFPVRMNLQIGMGILNTHSREELRAVLAHEFGHFSQRTMRLGSYVHSANKVLLHMLYDNDKLERNIDAWGDAISYFKLMGVLSKVVIEGMQAVLKQVYEVLNVNYYALSREMEYYADAVATTVAGSEVVTRSLLRLELAETSLTIVHVYHEAKVDQGLKPLNVYPQHYFVMNYLAPLRKIEIKNGLPEMDVDHVWKSTGTRIALRDPWATHPDITDRIQRVKALGIPAKIDAAEIAVNMLVNKEELQERLTAKIFEYYFIYAKTPELTNFQQFESDFLNQFSDDLFDERYVGYYQNKLPYYKFDQSLLDGPVESDLTDVELFNNEGLIENLERDILEADIQLLENMMQEPGHIQNFSYDGLQYKVADAERLLVFLQESFEKIKELIEQRDRLIVDYFKRQAIHFNQLEQWKENSMSFKQVAEATISYQDAYQKLVNASHFMTVQTTFDWIEHSMIPFMESEKSFKTVLKEMLENPVYKAELSPEYTLMFEEFLAQDWVYYESKSYIEADLDRLFAILPIFKAHYFNTCVNHKRKFLSYQSSLFPEITVAIST